MGIARLSSQPVAAEVIPANVRASPRRRAPIEAIQAWLFLLPAVVILGVFQIFPAIAAFYMSLFKWDVVQGSFRGLGNYTDWLYDNSIRSPDFWRSLSTTFTFVIFLAGLSNISQDFYEAARLDGANERQIFTKITLPLLSPTTFFVFTVASIGVLRSFDSVYVLTNGFGGPLDTTRTVTLLVFKTAFQQAQFGLGAALAFILTMIILLFTLIQFRILGRRVFYG